MCESEAGLSYSHEIIEQNRPVAQHRIYSDIWTPPNNVNANEVPKKINPVCANCVALRNGVANTRSKRSPKLEGDPVQITCSIGKTAAVLQVSYPKVLNKRAQCNLIDNGVLVQKNCQD